MRRFFHIIYLLIALAVCVPAQGQIVVKSFELLPDDLDASTYFPKKDFNNKTCAIIKVFTTQKDFSFENGSLGIVEVVQKTAEIWVYVPENTIKLKIAHQQLGYLTNVERDGYYWFPERVKSGKCYRMDLTTGTVRMEVEEAVTSTGWIVFNSDPVGADVYLSVPGGEEQYIGVTPTSKKMPYGSYHYRATKFKYHDAMGLAVVDKDKMNVQMSLNPAFGKVSVTSTPSGAKVYLDGKDTGKITPCVLDEVNLGKVTLRLHMKDYAPATGNVVVREGETSSVNLSLNAIFAPVTINSLPGADIRVNGSSLGTSSYNGNLLEGIYDIEVLLASHKSVKKQIEVVANVPQTIELKPVPIYGMLDVSSNPMGANVTINGKSYGETPLTIKNLLIGDYDVILSKIGYESSTQRVSVEKENTASIDVKLQSGRMVSIATDKPGDEIYVDGNRVGISPCNVEIAFGSHEVKVVRGEETVTKTINVLQGTGIVDVKMGFEESEPEQVFTVVEQMPQFPGGRVALLKYLNTNMRYPPIAAENGKHGRVIVKFVVNKDGSVGKAKIIRGVDSDLDNEAIRLCKSLPKFIPGKMNGKAVNVWYTVPVIFRLAE